MDQTELRAITACQAGELTQFSLLYTMYIEKIYRFIYYKTWHRPTAEDLTSLTFMKALEHIADYSSTRGNFSSWLYRIAQNTVIDHYRTAKAEANIDDMYDLASRQNIAAEAETNLALAEVKDYLKTLDTETRDLLIMRLWQGLSYQEIADLTGKSEGALKMAASRALKTLRSQVSVAALLLLLIGFK